MMVRGVKNGDICSTPHCRSPTYVYRQGKPYCMKCDSKMSDEMTKRFEEEHREEIEANKANLRKLSLESI